MDPKSQEFILMLKIEAAKFCEERGIKTADLKFVVEAAFLRAGTVSAIKLIEDIKKM
jgi:hypothetical protein